MPKFIDPQNAAGNFSLARLQPTLLKAKTTGTRSVSKDIARVSLRPCRVSAAILSGQCGRH